MYCPTTLYKPVPLSGVISGQMVICLSFPLVRFFSLYGCAIYFHYWISITSPNCPNLDHLLLFSKAKDTLSSIFLVNLDLPIDADGSQDACSFPPQTAEFASPLPAGFLQCQEFSWLPAIVVWQSQCHLNQPQQWRMGVNTKCLSLLLSGWVILRCVAPCTADPGLTEETSSLTHLLLAFPLSLSNFPLFLSCVPRSPL